MFLSWTLVVVILISSIAAASMLRRLQVTNLEAVEPDVIYIFEVVDYGNTEIQEKMQPRMMDILLAKYVRCFMSVLRMGHIVTDRWKEKLVSSVKFVYGM